MLIKGITNITEIHVAVTPKTQDQPNSRTTWWFAQASEPIPMAVVSEVRKQASPTSSNVRLQATRAGNPSRMHLRMWIMICTPSVKPTRLRSTGRITKLNGFS